MEEAHILYDSLYLPGCSFLYGTILPWSARLVNCFADDLDSYSTFPLFMQIHCAFAHKKRA